MIVRISVLSLLLSLCAAAPVVAQSYVIQGRVVDAADGRPIADARLEMPGLARAVSDSAGGFRLAGAPAGRAVVRVTALGYVTREVVLMIERNTTVTLELQRQPLRLDSIEVATRLLNIRGRITDTGTGRGIADGYISAPPLRQARTMAGGYFRLDRVGFGQPLTVTVIAFGYLPAQLELIAVRDTTLEVELVVDSIMERRIVATEHLLANRAGATGHASSQLTRDDLRTMSSGTALDIVKYRLGRLRNTSCLLIDERLSQFGLKELESIPAERVHHIDVIDRGTMVRVYTNDFMARVVIGAVDLQPIVLMRSMGLVCQ